MSGSQDGSGFFDWGVHGILSALISKGSDMKYIVFVLLAAIVVSLGSGLFYLRSEDHDSPKMLAGPADPCRPVAGADPVPVASYLIGWIADLTNSQMGAAK